MWKALPWLGPRLAFLPSTSSWSWPVDGYKQRWTVALSQEELSSLRACPLPVLSIFGEFS